MFLTLSLSAVAQEFDLDGRVMSSIDTARQTSQAFRDTLVQSKSKAMAPVDSIQAEINKINQKATDSLQAIIPDKAKQLEDQTIELMEEVGVDSPDLIPNELSKKQQVINTKLVRRGIKMPEGIEGERLDLVPEKLNALQGKAEGYVEEIKQAGELQEVQGKAASAEQISKEAQGYQKEAKAITSGNFDSAENLQKEVEEKVSDLDEMQALEQQAAAQEKYESKLRQLNNAKYLKGQLQDKLKEAGIGNLSDYKGKVKETMGKLSKYKKKYSTIQTSKEIPEKRDNPLADKKFKERLVVGGNFQLHSGDPVALDISPLIGYRFTPKLSVGMGGTYRQTFKVKDKLNYSVVQDAIGGRVFGEYKTVRSFFVHAEFEVLHTRGHETLLEDEPDHWNKGALAGIGRTFKLTKDINGNVMVLYNFLHQENGPYRKPLMVRFGLDF